MPFPVEAIPGQPSLPRTQKKAKRLAQENLPNLPNWVKNWTPDEMEAYVETNVTDLASAKLVLQKLAWLCGALRDYMLLKQEGD
jgi:hypothetical protein